MLSLGSAPRPRQVASPPATLPGGPVPIIEIAEVYNPANWTQRYVTLYNNSLTPVPLRGWQLCTKDIRLPLPDDLVIAPQEALIIKAPDLPGWPLGAPDADADFMGLLDPRGAPVEAINWGQADSTWRNYGLFASLLWPQGIPITVQGRGQWFKRKAHDQAARSPDQWEHLVIPRITVHGQGVQ